MNGARGCSRRSGGKPESRPGVGGRKRSRGGEGKSAGGGEGQRRGGALRAARRRVLAGAGRFGAAVRSGSCRTLRSPSAPDPAEESGLG